jgi:hypothetical protein
MGYDDATSKIIIYNLEGKTKVLVDGFHRTEANRANKISAPNHYKKNINCILLSASIKILYLYFKYIIFIYFSYTRK